MAKNRTAVVTIDRVERLGVSVYGNPYYRIHTTDGESYRTQINASINYSIENSENFGRTVELSMTEAGRVWDIKAVVSETPSTYTDEQLYIGMLVLARPYYYTPSSRYVLKGTRSPFVYEGRIVDHFGDMWTVEFTWGAEAPWKKRQIFKASELHTSECTCPACKGDGIQDQLHGA
jgi:hypothetical protein